MRTRLRPSIHLIAPVWSPAKSNEWLTATMARVLAPTADCRRALCWASKRSTTAGAWTCRASNLCYRGPLQGLWHPWTARQVAARKGRKSSFLCPVPPSASNEVSRMLEQRKTSTKSVQGSLQEREEGSVGASSGSAIHGGFIFEGTVPPGPQKKRLDSYVAEQIPRASRAKVQTCIRGGHVLVNSQLQTKPACMLRPGDVVLCRLPPPPPLEASPEPIPLEVVYEDAHLLVVNKPPHMVVHPSPGHYSGTLVNALLHHCELPAMQVVSGSTASDEPSSPSASPSPGPGAGEWVEGAMDMGAEDELLQDEEDPPVASLAPLPGLRGPQPILRPGIVHRLDKGTSGLLVVAKDEYTHARLCDQFKARSVQRAYVSLTCGVPQPRQERIEAPIGRDPRDRKRMAVVAPHGHGGRSRFAASRYRVVEVLAGGGASMVEWRLETGRTHQIRVHAKHVGHPILGDEDYGGAGKSALAGLLCHLPSSQRAGAQQLVARLSRPCLHARTLGFVHPESGKEMFFSMEPPSDFDEVVDALRQLQQSMGHL